MAELTPALERRTWHLMRCIERRQSAGDGYVDLGEAFYHFAYDLGVSHRTAPLSDFIR